MGALMLLRFLAIASSNLGAEFQRQTTEERGRGRLQRLDLWRNRVSFIGWLAVAPACHCAPPFVFSLSLRARIAREQSRPSPRCGGGPCREGLEIWVSARAPVVPTLPHP